MLRQVWSEHERKVVVSYIVLSCICLLFLVAVVAVLTVARAEFSAGALQNGVGRIFDSVGDKISESGIVAALSHALSDTWAQVLAALNAVCLLLTFLFGYIAHDPDRNFDKAFEHLRSTRRALAKLDRKYKSACASVTREAARELDDLNRRYTAANAAIVALKGQRGIALTEDDNFVLSSADRRLARLRDSAYGVQVEPSPVPPTSSPPPLPGDATRDGAVTRFPARETR